MRATTAIEASDKLTAERVRVRVAAPPRGGIAWPWKDRAGRFSPLKAVVFLAMLAPGIVLIAEWATGNAGARPLLATIHGFGLWTIRFLLLTLAITPARRLANWPKAGLLRRMLGVTALCYALVHFGLYVADENFRLVTVASEIVHHIYLTIGFVVLLGLVALGATSTDRAMKAMKRNWKRLHRILYVLVPLGILHFFMQSKADVSQAVLVGGFFIWLMLWRALPPRWEIRFFALAGIAVVAALGTACIEYAWYDLATHINPMRVLMANLDVGLAIRPAVWVGIVGLALAALVMLRHQGAMMLARARAHRRVLARARE